MNVYSSVATATTSNVTNTTAPVNVSSFIFRHYIGIALALCGNLLISISLSIQKKAHNRLGQDNNSRYCIDKWWWLGMILMALGEVGNFMAYGFAPASMVAPLGSVGVIANTIIAAIFLKEPLTMPTMMGVSLVVVGSVILINFSVFDKPLITSSEIISYFKAWQFLLYISVEFILLLFLIYLKYRRNNEHLVILLLLGAVIASVTVITAKALSTVISEFILKGKFYILNPVFWVSLVILPVTTAAQIRFLNRAMQLYDVSDVVPVNFIFFTISAVLAGAMFYQEFYGVAIDQIVMFMFGCMQSFLGVCIITQQKKDKEDFEERNKEPDNNNLNETRTDGCNSPQNQTFNDSLLSPNASTSVPVGESAAGSRSDGVTEFKKQTHNFTSNGFYKRFVKLVKSSESISEIQPLLSS